MYGEISTLCYGGCFRIRGLGVFKPSQGVALTSLSIELYDPVTLMFFFRNKHMMCDFGTGNNNKLQLGAQRTSRKLIDIIETIYRGAKKGRGLVVSPKGELNLCLPARDAEG